MPFLHKANVTIYSQVVHQPSGIRHQDVWVWIWVWSECEFVVSTSACPSQWQSTPQIPCVRLYCRALSFFISFLIILRLAPSSQNSQKKIRNFEIWGTYSAIILLSPGLWDTILDTLAMIPWPCSQSQKCIQSPSSHIPLTPHGCSFCITRMTCTSPCSRTQKETERTSAIKLTLRA